MGRSDYTTCRNCGRHASEVGVLSHTRLCSECSEELLRVNVTALVTKTGPNFLLWRQRMAACVGATLDTTRESV